MKKIILATLIGSVMGMSGMTLAAEGDDMPLVEGDVSNAALKWTGSVEGIVSGDGFTLTGAGGSPLKTNQLLNITPGGTSGTYNLASKRNVTIEAHVLAEGSEAGVAADPEEIAGLVPNPVVWTLGDVGFTTGGATLDKSKMMFLLSSTTVAGESAGEEFAGDDLQPTLGNNTVELSFNAADVDGLTPGLDVEVSATVLATIGAIGVAP